jgi:hypothetical protein
MVLPVEILSHKWLFIAMFYTEYGLVLMTRLCYDTAKMEI